MFWVILSWHGSRRALRQRWTGIVHESHSGGSVSYNPVGHSWSRGLCSPLKHKSSPKSCDTKEQWSVKSWRCHSTWHTGIRAPPPRTRRYLVVNKQTRMHHWPQSHAHAGLACTWSRPTPVQVVSRWHTLCPLSSGHCWELLILIAAIGLVVPHSSFGWKGCNLEGEQLRQVDPPILS